MRLAERYGLGSGTEEAILKEQKTTRRLRHEFTQEELLQAGLDLAMALEKMKEVQAAKALANEEFKQQLDTLTNQVRDLRIGIRERGEDRSVECLVKFHSPRVGTKEIFRLDSGEKVAEEAMSFGECQEHLFAGEAEKGEAASG